LRRVSAPEQLRNPRPATQLGYDPTPAAAAALTKATVPALRTKQGVRYATGCGRPVPEKRAQSISGEAAAHETLQGKVKRAIGAITTGSPRGFKASGLGKDLAA
jgi:hypothetical protein